MAFVRHIKKRIEDEHENEHVDDDVLIACCVFATL
jgi:hypothetical protein